jgi:hypothetical protein
MGVIHMCGLGRIVESSSSLIFPVFLERGGRCSRGIRGGLRAPGGWSGRGGLGRLGAGRLGGRGRRRGEHKRW